MASKRMSGGDTLTKAGLRAQQTSAILLGWARTREGARFFALLGVGPAAPAGDRPVHSAHGGSGGVCHRGELLLHHPLDPYSFSGADPIWLVVPGYPPLSRYIFGVLEGVYFGVGHLLGLHLNHDPLSSATLRLMLERLAHEQVPAGLPLSPGCVSPLVKSSRPAGCRWPSDHGWSVPEKLAR
jgi:hypothetical protein